MSYDVGKENYISGDMSITNKSNENENLDIKRTNSKGFDEVEIKG